MTNRRSEAPLALVTGISGVQGAAAARWLLAEGFRVRGWTALPDSDVTRSLHALGCDILTGPLDTPERAGAAMAGARAVVSWQEYDVLGVDREVDQGRSLAAAAAGAGVEMLVYISTANARLRTGLLRFDVKERIEEQVRASGVPYSILRPAFPMQELERYGEEIERRGGRLELPVGPEVPLELIDLDDVAAIASRAASNPESFGGR
ncbi:MAG: NmrA family NAD(P)-binding protein [Candidatus Eisenbacteria bacterium]|nr:NmrA family NAD(P)-binding protein [Candidatus Eisenbacteria bacterium]